MASKSLESRSEIEGAKRQLTVAQKWLTSANDMLKVIIQTQIEVGAPKQIIEFSREQLSLSEKEVTEARAYLKKIEARWEVISIDVDDNEQSVSSKVQNSTSTSHAPSLRNNQSSMRLNDDAVILSDGSNDAEDKTNNVAATAPSAAPSPRIDFPIGSRVLLQNMITVEQIFYGNESQYNGHQGVVSKKISHAYDYKRDLYTISLPGGKEITVFPPNMKLVEQNETFASMSATSPAFNIGNKVMLQNTTPTYNSQLGIIKSKPNDTLYTIELLVSKKLVNAKLINMKLVDGSVANEVAGAASTSNIVSEESRSRVTSASTSPAASTSKSTAATNKVKNEKINPIEVDDDDYIPNHITVYGCGVSNANGVYTITGKHDNAPRYSMSMNSYPHTRYTILREDVNGTNKWLLLGTTPHPSGLYEKENTVCHSTALANREKVPPLYRWKVAKGDSIYIQGKRYVCNPRLPSPQLSHPPKKTRRKDKSYFGSESEIVDELLVESCGIEQINGIYKKCDYINEAPSYFKARVLDDLPHVYIYRKEVYGTSYWYIALLEGDKWVLKYVYATNLKGLPLSARQPDENNPANNQWLRKYTNVSTVVPVVKVNDDRVEISRDQSNKRARHV